MEHNLRHLRVFLAVVEHASVTRAAEAGRVSQPAVTQALNKLERQVGAPLFKRTPQGRPSPVPHASPSPNWHKRRWSSRRRWAARSAGS